MHRQANSLVRQQERLMATNSKFAPASIGGVLGALGALWSGSHAATIPVVMIVALCTVLASSTKASCKAPGTPMVAAFAHGSQLLASPRAEDQNQSSEPDGQDDQEASIVGLWSVTVYSGGQVFDQGFDQWHSDGTELLNDIISPEPANGSGAFCMGVYKKTGPRTYRLRHVGWLFDANGTLVGTSLVLERITVDKRGRSYSGSCSFLNYDLQGKLTGEVDGTLTAMRITPD